MPFFSWSMDVPEGRSYTAIHLTRIPPSSDPHSRCRERRTGPWQKYIVLLHSALGCVSTWKDFPSQVRIGTHSGPLPLVRYVCWARSWPSSSRGMLNWSFLKCKLLSPSVGGAHKAPGAGV
jgi:hypothetical protein